MLVMGTDLAETDYRDQGYRRFGHKGRNLSTTGYSKAFSIRMARTLISVRIATKFIGVLIIVTSTVIQQADGQ